MSNSPKTTTEQEKEKSSDSERTREEIEEETGGIVETEHGRRYRIQLISNSGSSKQSSQL